MKLNFSVQETPNNDAIVNIFRITGDDFEGYRFLPVGDDRYFCIPLLNERAYSVELLASGVYTMVTKRLGKESHEVEQIVEQFFYVDGNEFKEIQRTEVPDMLEWFDETLGRDMHRTALYDIF